MLARTPFLASSLLLFGASTGHMFLSSPSPMEGNAVKPPLDASGSDFPCHGVSLPSSGGQTMAAGSNQTISFDLGGGANTAVHGGGSCQISITYETDATKVKDPSNWKVIYSIEGGCPSDTKGNLETAVECNGSNSPDCVNSFPFTIPKGVKDGHAIMAWTWFNNVGNREMYMNCINAEFTSGDGSEMDSFPSMFVANLASVDQCPTTESVNVKFPDPGKYVTTHTQGNPYPLAIPTGAGCSGDGLDGSGANSKAAATPVASSTAATTSSSATLTSTATPAAASSTAKAPSVSSATSQSAPVSDTCLTGYVSCPTPGDLICIDSSHFGICDIDYCALPQAVAPGTTCRNGTIVKKRSLRRHLEERLRKHHGHMHGH